MPILALKASLLALVLYFVGRYVVVHWQAVRDVDGPRPGPLVTATLLGICAALGMVWIVQRIAAAHGYRISFGQAFALRFVPPLGKYLPGKGWSLLASLWLYGRVGIAKHVAATCILLATIVGLLSQCLLVVAMQSGPWRDTGGYAALVAGATLLFVGVYPPVFYPCVNAVLRLTGQPALETKLSFVGLISIVAVALLAWSLFGLALLFVLQSTADVPLGRTPECIATFLFAQVAGFLVLFAPAGIGVREGLLLVGLSPLVGEGPAIVAAGLARLWQTFLDVGLAAVGWWFVRPHTSIQETQTETTS